MRESYDVVVIGGGSAGLSGALALVRARRSVLVIDARQPRNAPAAHVHNYLTQEGAAPDELLTAGRAEVANYGGELVEGVVRAATALAGGGFRIDLAGGRTVEARRLLVTTGLVDELPDVAGLADRWGRDVLHCPYCHGWEVRDEPLGVLATGPMAVHQALLWRQWSEDVTLFRHTEDPFSADDEKQLNARGIPVVDGKVTAIQVAEGNIVGLRLESGEMVPRRVLVVSPLFTARADVLISLGLTPYEHEVSGRVIATAVAADPSGATAVPGVWVAGNIVDPRLQVIGAAAAGLVAATAVNGDLVRQDVEDAMAVAG